MPLDRVANDQLEFLCKEISVPEVATNTIAANGHKDMGVVREHPTSIMFANPLSITVISDRDYTVYKAMREWYETSTSNGTANPNRDGGAVGASQRMAYFDDISRSIQLIKQEQNGEQSYYEPFNVTFNNAYPIRIGSIDLGSDKYDERVEYQIDFFYETYTFERDGSRF